MRSHGWILIPLLLTGCAGVRPSCPLPKTVTLTVTKYIALPPAFTSHLPTEKPQDRTCGEAVRVAKVRASAIDQCNSRLDAIKQATTP
jgi:hypothetical protein